jgi:hypothetical protein
MEDTLTTYYVLLGRPWLKQAKAHHDWGNNTFKIIINTQIMTLNI